MSFNSVEPLFFVDGYPFFLSRKRSQRVQRKPLLTRDIYCNRLRKIHSKGAIIVLVWVFLVWTSVNFVGEFANKLNLQVVGAKLLNRNNIDIALLGREIPLHYGYYATIGLIWLLGTPLIGWLADIRFGRYKVMLGSLWIIWCGVLVHGCIFLAHNHDQPSTSLSTVDSVVSFTALTVYMCGLVGFLINSVQFGMDQMPDASSPELSAFIHWYVFAMSAGIWFSETVLDLLASCSSSSSLRQHRGILSTAEIVVLALLPTLLVSLALLLDSYLRHHLIVEPQSKNPFKLVSGVLKYVAKHRRPANPSAYVYTLKNIPNRFDFAKTHYGGPYTTEQVEDVKTFLRILLLMSPGILILTSTILTAFNLEKFEGQLKSFPNTSQCSKTSIKFFVYDYRLLTMLLMVVNELLLHPVCISCYYFCCKTLRRILIGTVLGLVLSIFLAVIEITGHTVTYTNVTCSFLNETAPLNIFYLPVVIPVNFILAIQTILFTTGVWEFICAQAPYSMRGLLIGAAWASLAVALVFTNIVTIGWYYGSNKIKSSSTVQSIGCEGFYFLSILFLCLVGLVLFCIAVCWYRPRMREETEDQQLLVEEIYAKEVDAAAVNGRRTAFPIFESQNSGDLLGVTCASTSIQ